MNIVVTTALKKISALRKRIKIIQGGQGAGKTIAILILIINHAYSNSGKDIYIASQELSKMRITIIKDFLNVLKMLGVWDKDNWKAGKEYTAPNGSRITFIGLDKEDIGKGLRSDIIFLNEANKTSFETYRELTSRANQVIIDYNPNSEFWAHTEVINRDDAEHLILTYKDNEALSENEIKEILRYKTKAYFNPDLPTNQIERPDNIKSKYWLNKWHVYGLGIVGTNPNRIFFWKSCTEETYKDLNVPVYYGVDWGSVDPFAISEVKYYDGKLYVKELNYLSENELRERMTPEQNKMLKSQDEGLVKWLFSKLNIDRDRPIICDDNRRDKIKALRQMGYGYALRASKGKGSKLDGIDLLNSLEVFYTENSKNIEKEQRNYSRKVDRYGVVLEEPEDLEDHMMDNIRYVSLFLLKEGIIRNI